MSIRSNLYSERYECLVSQLKRYLADTLQVEKSACGLHLLFTLLWWVNLPVVVALLGFTALAWKDHYWRLWRRVYYTVVTVASVAFLAFLMNWHLLAGL